MRKVGPVSKVVLPANTSERLADALTAFSGSFIFVIMHVAWFGSWIVLNLTLPHPFDSFPFGLLTLIVSLEAIFLSAFVLMSQNRSGSVDHRRAIQDYRTNLESDVIINAIAEKLGIDREEVQRRIQARLTEAQDDLDNGVK